MPPSPQEPPTHTRCGSTCRVGWRSSQPRSLCCAAFVEREDFILLSCQSVTSPRLSAFPPRLPPLCCHRSQMCAAPGAAKFPVPRQGNGSDSHTSPGASTASPRPHQGTHISQTSSGDSQHFSNLTMGVAASPKPHQADPKKR